MPTATTYDVTDGVGDDCLAVAAPAVTCTLIGLTPGTAYTVTVTANMPTGTTMGTSAPFEVGPPGAPTGATATLNSDGTITADWAAPANVGAGIDHYIATASGGGGTCTTPDDTTTTCDIPAAALAPSTAYTVTVKAVGVDNVGQPAPANNSAASAASTAVTTSIGGPTSPLVTDNGDGTFTIDWTNPGNTTGIDHYTATTSPAGGSCSSTAATPAATTCDILTGVDPGVVYTVSVVANGTTAGVTSAASSPSAPFEAGDLNPPTNVTATVGDGTATVSWTAPMGALPGWIDYYTASSSTGDVCNTFPGSGATSCTVNNLNNLATYTFTVVAHASPAGLLAGHADSAASTASNAVIPLSSTVTLLASANGKYVTAANAGNSWLIANRTTAAAWETFTITQNSDGTVSLMAQVNGKYVSAEAGGAAPLIANRGSIGTWEKFTLVDNGDGTFSLKSSANGMYVTAEAGGARALVANRNSIGTWEKFTIS